jgi:glutamate/tyrosine decarboxylase-like PLP-dependent enzyme
LTEHRNLELAGIERAHSLTWDAHKWMSQPVGCSVLLVRDRHWLSATFKETAHFLTDAEAHSKEEVGEEMNFMYQGIQLTRYFRALKFWMSLKVFGLGAVRQAVERGFKLAELAESLLRDLGRWEIVTPAQMAIVTFRYKPADADEALANRVTDELSGAMAENGFAFASTTKLREKTAMRLCTNNPRTTSSDLRQTILLMERLAADLERRAKDAPASE